MRNCILTGLLFLVLPCTAGKDEFIPENDMVIPHTQAAASGWKVMGFCDSSSFVCIYMDTVKGYIVQLRRLDKKNFTIRDVDRPVAVDEIIEGAYLTSKFIQKKLKLINKSLFTITYEDKRKKMIIEVNDENKRVKTITFKK